MGEYQQANQKKEPRAEFHTISHTIKYTAQVDTSSSPWMIAM